MVVTTAIPRVTITVALLYKKTQMPTRKLKPIKSSKRIPSNRM